MVTRRCRRGGGGTPVTVGKPDTDAHLRGTEGSTPVRSSGESCKPSVPRRVMGNGGMFQRKALRASARPIINARGRHFQSQPQCAPWRVTPAEPVLPLLQIWWADRSDNGTHQACARCRGKRRGRFREARSQRSGPGNRRGTVSRTSSSEANSIDHGGATDLVAGADRHAPVTAIPASAF
jgi:hypothetical protein